MERHQGCGHAVAKLPANITEPSFLWEDDGDREEMEAFLEVEFPSLPESDGTAIFVS